MKSKAEAFDEIAENVFYPLYPIVAKQILDACQITEGICLDIGCGGGHLGIEVAKLSNLHIILMDYDKAAIEIANRRIDKLIAQKENFKTKQIEAIIGDVHHIPFESETMDLIISRGSLWFWNHEKSLREIWRVLKPGAKAYIGGGYGNAAVRDEIYEKMSIIDGVDWGKKRQEKNKGNLPVDYSELFPILGIQKYNLIDDESGIWFLIEKEWEYEINYNSRTTFFG